MAVDTPARIAILGAGPIGLEAALYARYLGYEVDVYERGRIGEHLLRWGHARQFTPFSAAASPLGLAALAAQGETWQPPAADALLSGREFVERYLAPLAHSDLLADSVHERTEVVAISRGGLLKSELSGEPRADEDFRLLLRAFGPPGANGDRATRAGERFAPADVVVDATGVYGQHNWLGLGGIPAIGEQSVAEHIEYGLPDVLGADRQRYAHRHTLVVGAGYAAAATVLALTRLGHEAPYTRVTWLTAHDSVADSGGPICRFSPDPWPHRDQLAREANQLIRNEIGHLTFWPATAVEQIHWHGGDPQFRAQLTGRHAGELDVDRIVADVGHRPDHRLYSELQVAVDPATDAPTHWPADASLLPLPLWERAAGDSDGVSIPAANLLLTTEPDFYVLGAKSVGRDERFTIAAGLLQIQQLFTIIGDRADLNLYARHDALR
jgi:glycine/D-amino acid oxidase-like deaminating enzyme